MATSDDDSNADAPPSIKARLRAWWEGYDVPGFAQKKPDNAPAAPQAGRKAATADEGLDRWGKPLWSATRIQVIEQLWGKGFTTPGANEHVPNLVKPFGLNPSMTVLDVAAGLGGATRAMVAKYGCWAVGLEGSPMLAKLGMERSVMAGLAKQAPVELFNPEAFSFPKRVDTILCKEGMFTVSDKNQLFDGMELCLKPRGQILITDYVVEPGKEDAGPVQGWVQHEPQEPKLWTLAQMTEAFAQRNLDLRIAEDITATQHKLIVDGIKGLATHMEKHHLDQDTKIAVMGEVEMWARRIAAMSSGVRVYRFYALKPPE
jgi:cyclopropane fatty-acyl-phospholipid synthase-like methyltransferase